jgi:16S rRNA (guanine527-N7)-methyltransferase
MNSELRKLLLSASEQLEIPLQPATLASLSSWLELMRAWNQRVDLTAARSSEEFVDLALADALVLSQLLPDRGRVLDVGSGAGAPGLPLALIRPGLTVTLLEPLVKRVAFLRTTIGTLGAGVALTRGRAQDLLKRGGCWDYVLSRATFEPQTWLQMGLQLVAGSSGSVVVFIARATPPQASGARLVRSLDYRWPLTGMQRTICIYAQERGPQGPVSSEAERWS